MKLPPAVTYTVLRLLAFLVPFGVLMLFPVFRELYWLAAIFAALIGLSLSVLFLRRPLTAVSQQVEARAGRRRDADEEAEDAEADASLAADAALHADVEASAPGEDAEATPGEPAQPTNAQNRNAP